MARWFCIFNTVIADERKEPGPWFNIKMPSYQYRKSHCGDKTVVRSSYLHNGISYTSKMSSLYWIGAQDISRNGIDLLIRDIPAPAPDVLTLCLLNFSEGKTYLRFMSFLHIDIAQVIEIPSHVRQGLPIISWVPMSWLLVSPGHQQPWYWLTMQNRINSVPAR